MLLKDYMAAIIADLKAHAPFLNDVGSHGKTFGMAELKQLSLNAPAVRIALVGVRAGSVKRVNTGQLAGPLQMIAFLIEQDWEGQEARDRVIDLADKFMTYIEARQWGLTVDCEPVIVTGFEILYTAEIDAEGAAIAAITWEQTVWFGRNLHDEDLADILGYPEMFPGYTKHPEKEWMDKGNLDQSPAVPPKARGTATGVFDPSVTEPDPEIPDESGQPHEDDYIDLSDEGE